MWVDSTGRPLQYVVVPELRLILADDNLLIREGVAAVLDTLDGVQIVAQCDDQPSLLRAVEQLQPDVVITDIRMPPTHTDEGIAAALTVRAEFPQIGIVVLSQFSEPTFVLALFENGSDGLAYLLKERVSPSELERAVRSVADGGSAVDAKIVEVLVAGRASQLSSVNSLTAREQEVLARIAEGLNNAAVAEALSLSEKAVSNHINSIFSKLQLGEVDGAHRRVKAVLMWLAR